MMLHYTPQLADIVVQISPNLYKMSCAIGAPNTWAIPLLSGYMSQVCSLPCIAVHDLA